MLSSSLESVMEKPTSLFFDGEVRIETVKWNPFAIVRVNGISQKIALFEVPRTPLETILRLREQWIYFDATNVAFYDNTPIEEQVKNLKNLSYEDTKARLPKSTRESFWEKQYHETQEMLISLENNDSGGRKEISKWNGQKSSKLNLKDGIKVGLMRTSVLLLCTQSSRAHPENPVAYMHDVIAFGGFEAATLLSHLIARYSSFHLWATLVRLVPGIWGKIIAGVAVVGTDLVIWGIWAEVALYWATALKIGKSYLVFNPAKILYSETPNSLIGTAVRTDLAWVADMTNVNVWIEMLWMNSWVDASEHPIDWSSHSVGRDTSAWNNQINAFEKRSAKEIAILVKKFFSASHSPRCGAISSHSETVPLSLEAKIKAFGEEFDNIFLKRNNAGRIDTYWTNEIILLKNEIINSLHLITKKDSPQIIIKTIIGDIEKWVYTDDFHQGFERAKLPNFTDEDVIKSRRKLWKENSGFTSQEISVGPGSDLKFEQNMTFNSLNKLSKRISQQGKMTPKEQIFFQNCLNNILQGIHPFGTGNEDNPTHKDLWSSLLHKTQKIQLEETDSKTNKPLEWELGDCILQAFNLTSDVRRISRFMENINRNGYGHEWRVAPQWSMLGSMEDKISK